MTTKYSNFIKLSATYESVVDLSSEKSNPNMWQEYIAQEDLRLTLEKFCETIEWADNDKRRSLWIHGTYGTGKSYAGIVFKHLLEDPISDIDAFLSKPYIAPLKTRWLKRVRGNGAFLVVWKSGATDIRTGTQLMMEMEKLIKEKLSEKFGNKAYPGRNSLIDAAKKAVNTPAINWECLFASPQYDLSDVYGSLDAFRNEVLSGDQKAILRVKQICDESQFAMFAGQVETFEAWIKDIIDGNGLKDTGIVFIWDEFTGYVRNKGDDNVLQRLSELCKSVDEGKKPKLNAPFFMCPIVHVDPSWGHEIMPDYNKILERYWDLRYSITPSAAYDLIGDSILPQSGYTIQWEDEKKKLLKTIESYKSDYDQLEQGIKIYDRLSKLCPLHPMTVSMLATVAENFGASSRTLFQFMKDKSGAQSNVGFIHYINTQGPDEWYWLTADYLWDYFFTRSSDVRDEEINEDIKKIIQHYQNSEELISGEFQMHVFKGAMLLIAVVSGRNISNLYSKQRTRNRIAATKRTLYKMFSGKLAEGQIDEYLDDLEQISVLRLDRQSNGDARLELPYKGSADLFDLKLAEIKKEYTRYKLFSKGGAFSKALEGDKKTSQLWDVYRATYPRIYIAVCSSEKISIDARLTEVKDELRKSPYKIGLLVVAVATASDYTVFQREVLRRAGEDDTKRLVVALLKEPCTDAILDQWHHAIANRDLANNDKKTQSASDYEAEATATILSWCASATGNQIYACYGNTVFPLLWGTTDLMRRVENDVLFTIFPAATERLITLNTVYNNRANGSAVAGLTGKAVASLTGKTEDKQLSSIKNKLQEINVWDINDWSKLAAVQGDNVTPIVELAKYFKQQFEQGAKISLDALWVGLQNPPFGYYNSKAAEVFVGLAMRPLINGTFNWIDQTGNNPHLPDVPNLSSMINKMMNGQTLNHYLFSGSATWQKFKPYVKSVFSLKDDECPSDIESRKYARKAITSIGVPFWSLKYVPAEKLGGEDAKMVINTLTDAFCNFIYKVSDDQESVMDTVLTNFNGRGGLKKVIVDTIADKTTMYSAFVEFVFSSADGLETLYNSLGLTAKELFDNIRDKMQDEINTWREDEVKAILPDLVNELSLISLLSAELDVTEKSYTAIQRVLNNALDYMVIPGTVIETLSYSWIPAMKLMRRISTTAWTDISATRELFDTLQAGAKAAWDMLSQPKIILEIVLNKRGVSCTEQEIDSVYSSLNQKRAVYEDKAEVFYTILDKLLDGVSYRRNAKEVKRLWKDETQTETIREWCKNVNCPAAWLFDGEDAADIATIVAVQDDRIVDKDTLERALAFIKRGNLAILSDAKMIADRFFANVGESYREAFRTDSTTLYARLKTNSKITSEVYSWAGKAPDIRKVLDDFLRGKRVQEAKDRAKSMSADELRSVVLELLDINPQLYTHFLKK